MAVGAGQIGPNAILQLVPVLEEAGGALMRDRMLGLAGIERLPDGTEMIDEGPAARLHQVLRWAEPHRAPGLARKAGQGTADYILAHRIPAPAQAVLRGLPGRLAAPLLSRAIAAHAWTFAGSGQFRCVGAWKFEIADNPVVRGECADTPICHWHAAVFERLYRALVTPRAICRETACCAAGAKACRFEISRR